MKIIKVFLKKFYYVMKCEFFRREKKIARALNNFDAMERIEKQLINFKHSYFYF
jgi:hypothetical protein